MTALVIRGGAALLAAAGVATLLRRRGGSLLGLGSVAVLVGLVARAWLPDGFHADIAAQETLLLGPGFALLLLGFGRRGSSEAARAVAPCLVVVGLVGLVVPLPGPVPDLKLQHASAPAFFVTEAGATVFFAAASCCALAALRRGEAPPEPLTGTLLLLGFVVFSLCQIVGAWWAWLGWGAPFHWAPRHLISAAVWCLYAGVIHLRLTPWSPRRRGMLLALSLVPLAFLQVVYDVLQAWTTWTGGGTA